MTLELINAIVTTSTIIFAVIFFIGVKLEKLWLSLIGIIPVALYALFLIIGSFVYMWIKALN